MRWLIELKATPTFIIRQFHPGSGRRISLPQVPLGAPAAMPKDGVQVVIRNTYPLTKTVELLLNIIVNGDEFRSSWGPIAITGHAQWEDVPGLGWASYPPVGGMSPAQVNLTAVELAAGPGGHETEFGTDGFYFMHYDEGDNMKLILYDEHGLQNQTQTLSFLNAPAMSARLQTFFNGVDTGDVFGIALYDSTDPDLTEPPIIPDPVEVTAAPEEDSFIVCAKWYVNLLVNNFGQDYGLVDDGWRARGALIGIYLDSILSYADNLSPSGCVTLPAPGGAADIVIFFYGVAELQTDGNKTLQPVVKVLGIGEMHRHKKQYSIKNHLTHVSPIF